MTLSEYIGTVFAWFMLRAILVALSVWVVWVAVRSWSGPARRRRQHRRQIEDRRAKWDGMA